MALQQFRRRLGAIQLHGLLLGSDDRFVVGSVDGVVVEKLLNVPLDIWRGIDIHWQFSSDDGSAHGGVVITLLSWILDEHATEP